MAYYEHSWATKRDSTLTQKLFKCEPHRVLAKRVEPVVWAELVKFITDPRFVQTMMGQVRRGYGEDQMDSAG